MANVNYSEVVNIGGVDVEIEAEFSLSTCDTGIGSYEFWGQKGNDSCVGFEIDDCEWFGIASDLRQVTTEELVARGHVKRNRRWTKHRRQLQRRIERAFKDFDPFNDFDLDKVVDCANENCEPESHGPDWDDIADQRRDDADDVWEDRIAAVESCPSSQD